MQSGARPVNGLLKPVIRHFPYGLTLEPLQARIGAHLNFAPPPVSIVRQFLAGFPTPDPAEIQIREPTGAFSSVNLWFCADLLHRVPRVILFDPLPSQVTRPAVC